jgi:hypothetical protein
MLGTFLEIGIETSDIGSTFADLCTLGLAAVPVGDIRSGAYAVVSDGTVCLGLHQGSSEGPSLTFVRPNLEDYVRALRRLSVELEFARLGDQEFHEIGFRDPNGQLVTLVEARTFSPSLGEEPARSVCGKFLEFSLATGSLAQSQHFWEQLGLVVTADGEEPYAWRRMAGAGLTLGLYQSTLFRPGVLFTATQLGARLDFLRAKGYVVGAGAPMFPAGRPSATLSVKGAIPFYLVADPADAS